MKYYVGIASGSGTTTRGAYGVLSVACVYKSLEGIITSGITSFEIPPCYHAVQRSHRLYNLLTQRGPCIYLVLCTLVCTEMMTDSQRGTGNWRANTLQEDGGYESADQA